MSGSEGESVPRRFVVDTNVFVSAIKPFSSRSRTARTDTASLSLLMRLITDAELELFGNLWLFDEYKRLSEELNSETSELILGRLTGKMREVTQIGRKPSHGVGRIFRNGKFILPCFPPECTSTEVLSNLS